MACEILASGGGALALCTSSRVMPPRAPAIGSAAEGLEDKMPEPHRLIGDLLRARGDRAGARTEYQRFLALSPPYLKDIEEVKGILDTL